MPPKNKTAVDTAVERGIRRFDAAPPLHRLLWAAGIDARPPHYASFANNALLMGGFWGVCMAGFGVLYAMHLRPEGGPEIIAAPICIALVVAAAFGLAMATVFRSRARKARLPSWDEIEPSDR